MRLSEFWYAVGYEFGEAYGRVIVNDLVIADLGERTAHDALKAGLAPREVWLALCRAADVPPERQVAMTLPEPQFSDESDLAGWSE